MKKLVMKSKQAQSKKSKIFSLPLKKQGQMKMSFGMIFSIILIIIFLAFAFYGIKKFLAMQDAIQINQFMENLQTDVDKVWKSQSSSQEVEYRLPKKIYEICFIDDEGGNLILKFEEIYDRTNIENLDIVNTLGSKKNLCIETEGQVKFILSKDYGETLVTIKENA